MSGQCAGEEVSSLKEHRVPDTINFNFSPGAGSHANPHGQSPQQRQIHTLSAGMARGDAAVLPPLPQVVLPCVIGGVMGAFSAVDLAVDLSDNQPLITAWYSAQQTLPILSQWQRLVLPLLLIALVAKLIRITIPGFRVGAVGCTVGLAPAVIIPAVIITTIRAKRLLDASAFQPSVEDLAAITQMHAIRQVLSCLMLVSGVREYSLKLQAATSHLKQKGV